MNTPTPEEIKKECEKIQANWDKTQKYNRCVIHNPESSIVILKEEYRRKLIKVAGQI